jgi:hypothetical protein
MGARDVRARAPDIREMKMSNCFARLRLAFAVSAAALSIAAVAQAAELDPKAVVFKTPDQFVWADPTDKVATNRTVLYGDPEKPGACDIDINKFKPNRFGGPHFHPTIASSP